MDALYFNGEKVLTSKQLAEYYEVDSKILNNNYSRNKDKYVDGVHYYKLYGDEIKVFKEGFPQIEEQLKYTSTLFLWTEKGCLMHSKSLGTDKAWEVYDKLIDTYFRAKSVDLKMSNLSPELQVLINMEIRQKEIEQKQLESDQKICKLEGKVDNIKNIITMTPESEWRKTSNKIINAIVKNINENISVAPVEHKHVRDEIYAELNKRARANIHRRLANKKNRMVAAGTSLSKVAEINYLDIIGEDPALTQLYIQIVKEFAIKYDLDLNSLQ